LNILQEVLSLLDEILSLNGRAATFTKDTALLGAIPELDSMAVVGLITGMEERFGYIADDEYVEVTPKSIRLRKIWLDPNDRKRMMRAAKAS
jgi:acyl carrier protein